MLRKNVRTGKRDRICPFRSNPDRSEKRREVWALLGKIWDTWHAPSYRRCGKKDDTLNRPACLKIWREVWERRARQNE